MEEKKNNHVKIDVSNPEVSDIVEFYNELISEIIEIYEKDSDNNATTINKNSTKVAYLLKKTILWKFCRNIKHVGLKATFKKIRTHIVGEKNENIRG